MVIKNTVTKNMVTQDKHRRRVISLTPLIDVVFILLVFFMLASNYQKWTSFPLDSAKSGKSHGSSTEKALFVRIFPNRIDLNGRQLNLNELEQFMSKKVQDIPSLKVYLQTQKSVDVQRLVDVVDLVSRTGCKNLAIIES